MPRARKHLVCLADTPFYHITSRCVRRAFLCGFDNVTGRSYEHRRGWLERRLRALASLFSIDICAYAIMSNHYHLVVKINEREPHNWSDDNVLDRWTSLFKGPLLVQRYRAGDPLSAAERATLRSIAQVYRCRLGGLSWFMKCLNEPIARQANAEDDCTGHFWEARFHSLALRSEQALLAAMAYVDLNPVRAGMAETLESSDYTSIRIRLRAQREDELVTAISRLIGAGSLHHFNVPVRPLMPFSRQNRKTNNEDLHSETSVPIRDRDYFTLLDATRRAFRRGKQGRIDTTLKSILERIGLPEDHLALGTPTFREFHRTVARRSLKLA